MALTEAALGTLAGLAGTVGPSIISGGANIISSLINSRNSGWGTEGSSSSASGGVSGGAGHSESGSSSWSKAGTDIEQVSKWLSQAYGYQSAEGQAQQKWNKNSMLAQMGYNTLSAITQGVYNHIENQTAMNYNSAEAAANRNWQEEMSNTAYQRAVEDMRKAGLNPILAFSNGGASTPGGAQGTINGASMGLASSSALGVSRANGFAPNAYNSESGSSSWSISDWQQAAEQWSRMLSEQHLTPYGAAKTFEKINNAADKFNEKIQQYKEV